MITPKEKAKELIDKMYFSRRYREEENYIPEQAWIHAKNCALIAVDEILNSGIHVEFYFDNSVGYMLSYDEYYEEVKQELKSL